MLLQMAPATPASCAEAWCPALGKRRTRTSGARSDISDFVQDCCCSRLARLPVDRGAGSTLVCQICLCAIWAGPKLPHQTSESRPWRIRRGKNARSSYTLCGKTATASTKSSVFCVQLGPAPSCVACSGDWRTPLPEH